MGRSPRDTCHALPLYQFARNDDRTLSCVADRAAIPDKHQRGPFSHFLHGLLDHRQRRGAVGADRRSVEGHDRDVVGNAVALLLRGTHEGYRHVVACRDNGGRLVPLLKKQEEILIETIKGVGGELEFIGSPTGLKEMGRGAFPDAGSIQPLHVSQMVPKDHVHGRRDP
ncbi:oxidoreductase protein (plasmid) [Rhizobium favelukesii]|uniref:Oxidoreductase protein n=1 Tax=Rhizobium favelukesii TaxID=348824 RepID=W6S4C6_9HYPH|nr:oxidoreductase protein [Rhizobium favelukesii]